MKNDDKASISLKKIICISILFIFIMAVAVTAGNVKLNNVKISLASGYEMNVLTSKKTVAEILDENHIILLEDEKVVPDLDSELSDNNTIKITKKTEEEIETPEVVETSTNVTAEEILDSYGTIIEKIEVEKVKIPYETITKNVAKGSGKKQDKIVQYGVDGLKEVTYKVKYQNEKEIEKKEISSKIIRKPVDKIVEVRNKQQITSRSGTKVRYAGKW
ncbi:MAG: G5 domain-containing protein, partial [Intestinibacter sp.]